jgi:hypothetical protein
MVDEAQAQGIGEAVGPDGILRNALAESVLFGVELTQDFPIFGYGPDSKGAADIETVKQKVFERIRKAAALAVDAAGA